MDIFSDVAEGAGFILFPVCSQNGIEEIAAMCSGLIIAGRAGTFTLNTMVKNLMEI